MHFSKIVISLLVYSNLVFANWAEDFELLKNTPRSYEDAGAICEELARLKFEKKYDKKDYDVVVGIAYDDTRATVGELDIIVFNHQENKVIHIAEVKCWKDMKAGLEKAKDQRQRFLSHIRSTKPLRFRSTSTDQIYQTEQFKGVTNFSTLGQKGSTAFGYDEELEYELRELHHMTSDMLRCQDRGECAKPN